MARIWVHFIHTISMIWYSLFTNVIEGTVTSRATFSNRLSSGSFQSSSPCWSCSCCGYWWQWDARVNDRNEAGNHFHGHRSSIRWLFSSAWHRIALASVEPNDGFWCHTQCSDCSWESSTSTAFFYFSHRQQQIRKSSPSNSCPMQIFHCMATVRFSLPIKILPLECNGELLHRSTESIEAWSNDTLNWSIHSKEWNRTPLGIDIVRERNQKERGFCIFDDERICQAIYSTDKCWEAIVFAW